MAARSARIRTESMAVKLSKQPISEGYALWDKGYVLGAMRLFIFKAESVPPFQLAGCLDAIAHLMMQVEEFEDAIENFTNAAEKYEMIQHPILAKYCRAKILEAKSDPAGALAAVNELLKEFQGDLSGKDAKTKAGLARVFFYRAELLVKTDDIANAIADATQAVALGWDRVHTGQILLGNLLAMKGNKDASLSAFKSATSNINSYAAYEGVALGLKDLKRFSEALPFFDHALSLQTKTTLIREKAFCLAEIEGKDVEAIALLDQYIKEPPKEEFDPTIPPLPRCTLHKAKAAVLADAGKFGEALAVLEAAKELDASDAEIPGMITQIKDAQQ